MKTWNITDAEGKQHQVSADDIQGTDTVRLLSEKNAGGHRNLIASFTKPIAVREAAPHLINGDGQDFGEIEEVDWQDGHYLVYVKEERE